MSFKKNLLSIQLFFVKNYHLICELTLIFTNTVRNHGIVKKKMKFATFRKEIITKKYNIIFIGKMACEQIA